MARRPSPVPESMWVVLTVMMVLPVVTAVDNQTASLDCRLCTCSHQGSVFSLRCDLTGTEDMALDGPGPLDFSSRTLYVRVENARSLHVGEGFLNALRRYHSVAVDFWTIGNLTFATDFHPKNRFLFMGMGIVNSSLPELPQGIISHSNAVGLRLSGSSVGVIRQGAFAQAYKVRYIELTDSQVGSVEGPQIGRLQLSHRQHVHHGSSGLQVRRCSIGALQKGALTVDTQTDDEFVEITDSTIAELGPGGLTVVGVGFITINHTVFRYLATGALDINASGGISLLHSRVSAAAPAPLWRVRGGNGTRLENITFSQPPSASLVLLHQPTGDEALGRLRFGCGSVGPPPAGWTIPAAAGRHTVSSGLRRFLLGVEEVAECEPAAATGGAGPRTAASSRPAAATGGGLFTNASQVGLELLILALAATVCAALAVAVLAGKRRWQRAAAAADIQALVEADDASEG